MKRKKLIVCVIMIVAFIGLFTGCLSRGLSEGANVILYGIDVSNVPDGSYTGVYEFRRWSNKLVVHVNDKKITEIDIARNIMGPNVKKISGEIFNRVIEAQNTTVDVVSGATVTSKAYLKAIENAFTSILQ